MPWQSLRITRQRTCDTLRYPKRGQMTYRRLIQSRLIFLYSSVRRLRRTLLFILQIGQFAVLSEVGIGIFCKGI